MNFLIFILAFLMAADENTCTRVLHRPLCACTLFGAVLGNAAAGLAAGAILELSAIALDSVTADNYIIPSLVAALMAANGTDASAAAAAGILFFGAGILVKGAAALLNTALLPSARKAAENRRSGTLTIDVIISLVIYGLVFGILALIVSGFGVNAAEKLSALLETNGWILSVLHTASVLAGTVGIAVLYRNLGGAKIPGAFLGGFAMASLICAVGLNTAAALLCAFAAFGIAAFDYHLRAQKAEKPAEKKEIKKGGAQWW